MNTAERRKVERLIKRYRELLLLETMIVRDAMRLKLFNVGFLRRLKVNIRICPMNATDK